MSQENVEVVKRAVEAGTRFDIPALLQELDPAIEWHAALPTLLGGQEAVYHGHEGVRALFQDLEEAFAESELDLPDIRDLGDRILAIGHIRNRGRGSGAKVESPIAYLIDFKNGKQILVRTYLEPSEALEVAGLSE